MTKACHEDECHVQADSAWPGKEVLSIPTAGLDSCQSTSSPSCCMLDSPQAQTAAPLAAASGAANVHNLCEVAPQLVQTQAQPQPVFTGPLKAQPLPPPPPPPPPQSWLHIRLQAPSSGPPPPPQACLAAAADPALPPAFMPAQAPAAMPAQALSVMSPVAALPSLQDSSAQTPLSGSIATMPVATAGSYAVGHGVPAPQAMEDIPTAESTLSAETALAGLAQPVLRTATAALAADSPSLSASQPGLPLTSNSMSATCDLSTLPLTVDPVATALPLRATPAVLPALADPTLLGVPPESPVAVASADPVVTATAATAAAATALSASAGQSSGATAVVPEAVVSMMANATAGTQAATAVLPEAVVSMMANATAGIQAATAALSAAAHEHKGQGTGADLLYDHLAAVLATAPATRDRALTFSPPCHSHTTLGSEHSGMLKPDWTYVAGKS